MGKKTKREIVDEASQKSEEAAKDFLGDSYVEPVKRRERPKNLEVVSSGAGYHDFKHNPIFEGSYVSKFLAPKDIPSNRTKKGDVIGFNFVEEGTGKECIISNSYAIQKALEEDAFSTNTTWWIEFIEKKMVKGKPFNSFYIAKVK